MSCHVADETVTLSAVLERLSPHLAQIKVLHKVFCTGVAEVPSATSNVVRASHLLNTLYKAIIEYDSVGEASEQTVRGLSSACGVGFMDVCKETVLREDFCSSGGSAVFFMDRNSQAVFRNCG